MDKRKLHWILIFVFILSLNGKAQLIIKGDGSSPKNQCKALYKKRHGKGNRSSTRGKGSAPVKTITYNQPVISPQRLAMERAQMEEDRNASQFNDDQLEASADTRVEFKTFQPDDAEPIDINNLPPPINEKHREVRQKVFDMIKRGEADQPITESLYFITDEDEFAYVDFEPFLMAVEFAFQGKMVLVEGHTDSRGNDEHNLQLSMKRVRQIERLMREIGVPEDKISVIGYGESMPSYDNSTEEGRQKNRRVDFKIY